MASASFVYFVMAHQRPEQLRLLVDAIQDPRDLIFIHVDIKSLLGLQSRRNGTWSMARRLAKQYRNVRLLFPRSANWGGWTLSKLLLDTIDLALKSSNDWTHFINLSGQCYPIKPLEEIRDSLAAAGDQVFVELRHLSTLPSDDWHLRWHPMIELPHKAYKLKGPRTPPTDFALEYKGSQWCMLPRSFCEWQREAAISKTIRRYLSGLLLSDEMIIQALVQNSPWRDRTASHYGREIVFPPKGHPLWPGPTTLTMEDWPLLMSSAGFFARKFDQTVDAEIVPKLSQTFGLRMSADAATGSIVRGD
jgi:hypothetical protein